MVFGAALSGVQAASKELGVIGNNIANSATNGFKNSRTEFADIYAGTSSNAVGQGVRISNIKQQFTQGNISFTENSLDLAINGEGFFMLSESGAVSYTRAGSYELDRLGFIVNSSNTNQILRGLNVDANGDLEQVTDDLQITVDNSAPNPTRSVEYGFNLDSRLSPPADPWVPGVFPGAPLPEFANKSDPTTHATTTYNNTSAVAIYDSLGNQHVLSPFFRKSAVVNQWEVYFQVTSDGQARDVNVVEATVPFDPDSTPPVPASGVAPAAFESNALLNFNNDGTFASATDSTGDAYASNLVNFWYDPGNGADQIRIRIDFNSSTQFGSDFAVRSNIQDGFTAGRLNGLDIANTGEIFGRFSNGQSEVLGQVQMANFANVNALRPIGDTGWIETLDSGQPTVGTPGTAQLGSVSAGSLEDSNVDLTSELVKLITAQRNFQANAQTIRTADTVTQTIINLR